jgi:hypothetical protein
MAPQVKRYKTAFQYYQADHLGNLRKEIPDMSACMTELSTRWKALDDASKQIYVDRERQDRERYQRETDEADAAKLRQQEEEFAGTNRTRGRRQRPVAGARQDGRKSAKRRRHDGCKRQADMDPEELEERNRYETKRGQKQKIDDANEMPKRRQSLNDIPNLIRKPPKRQRSDWNTYCNSRTFSRNFTKRATRKRERKPPAKKKSHRDDTAVATDDDVEGEEEAEDHVFLTKQPSCITFGD